MFTGIIQSLGEITSLTSVGDAISIRVFVENFFKDCKKGDSVANNGVCLTVEECNANEATFTLVRQTLKSSAFGKAAKGDLINLEFPCKPNSFMGGHFVMGHVDGVAKVSLINKLETGMEIDLEIPENLSKYVIQKGSITLNGISLTVAEKLKDNKIRVAIIPETIRVTNISQWIVGSPVNIEVDMIGKYIESLIGANMESLQGVKKE